MEKNKNRKFTIFNVHGNLKFGNVVSFSGPTPPKTVHRDDSVTLEVCPHANIHLLFTGLFKMNLPQADSLFLRKVSVRIIYVP